MGRFLSSCWKSHNLLKVCLVEVIVLKRAVFAVGPHSSFISQLPSQLLRVSLPGLSWKGENIKGKLFLILTVHKGSLDRKHQLFTCTRSRYLLKKVGVAKLCFVMKLASTCICFLRIFLFVRGSFIADVEVEISGRGSSGKHMRQSNWECFWLFVNIYILKTYLIWLSSIFVLPDWKHIKQSNWVCF